MDSFDPALAAYDGEAIDQDEMTTSPLSARLKYADAQGDISGLIADQLAGIASDVITDYERDLADAKEWREAAEKAIKSAAQRDGGPKDTPWPNASNVKYPLLTVAALQFNARAYPAIVKGDEAVSIKVVGSDKGRPIMVPGPMGLQPLARPDGSPVWEREPGDKKRRAARVKDFMNTAIFYRMKGWEEDTDHLLMMLPIVGCMFRKVTWCKDRASVRLISGLKLVAPLWTVDCQTAPRLTEVIDNLAGYQVEQKMASGDYRRVELGEDEDKQKPRLILEQHRFMDLDDDGTAEPYIITVDKEASEVLRIEPNFSREEALDDPDEPIRKQSVYYVKYDFLPNPNGEFYGYGFGHLIEQIGDVVNTLFNQLLDAGTAAIAGGGFIASGIRLQSKGGSLRWRPGEYKTVDVQGQALREGLIERTFPQVSPVSFQLLDLMMAAARDITSVKDVITGDASNNGQVGTTLALIEQGLAQFTAVYKRVYRSLKEEFTLIFESMFKWGGDDIAEDYAKVLDDPLADFASDFNQDDFDIRPVSDPTSVTKMQKMSRAEFLMGFRGQGLDDMEITRRALEAADIEDIEGLMPKQAPEPNPAMVAGVKKTEAEAADKAASAEGRAIENLIRAAEAGIALGQMDGPDAGRLPDMAGQPSNEMDFSGGRAFGG